MSMTAPCTLRWHIPLVPNLATGTLRGDFSVGRNYFSSGAELKRFVQKLPPMPGVIFEVMAASTDGKMSVARCLRPQIEAWQPSLRSLPMTVEIDLPVSPSDLISKVSDEFTGTLNKACEYGLIDEGHAVQLRHFLIEALRRRFL